MDKMIGIIDLQHKLRAVFNRFTRADETRALKRFDALLERMAVVNAKYSDEEVETDLKEATKIVRSRRKKA